MRNDIRICGRKSRTGFCVSGDTRCFLIPDTIVSTKLVLNSSAHASMSASETSPPYEAWKVKDDLEGETGRAIILGGVVWLEVMVEVSKFPRKSIY